jgi:hypothetical protein
MQLAKVPDHHVRLLIGTTAARNPRLTAATGPPLGPVVDSVKVTGTAAPARLTVAGLKVRLMPDGSEGLVKVTVLGILDRGVTFMIAVWDCPATTLIVVF